MMLPTPETLVGWVLMFWIALCLTMLWATRPATTAAFGVEPNVQKLTRRMNTIAWNIFWFVSGALLVFAVNVISNV